MEDPREFLDRMQAELKRTGNTPPETLSGFLAIMKQKLLAEGDDPVALKKTQLCELILPAVVGKIVGGNFQIDHAAAKTWAFACGELLGILAGLSIKERALDGAIDEVAAGAKLVARGLQKAITEGGMSAPETSTLAIERMKADSVTQSREMVKDMLAQAEAETDPAAASALRAMAESIKASIPKAA